MKWNSDPAAVGRERGWTMIGAVVILCLLAFVVVIGFRLVPMYLDYFTVQSSLESLKSQPEVARMSKYDILASIQRRFDVGYVDVVTSKDVKIKQDKDGRFVELVYEDRRPLLANLEIVGKFNKTVRLE
jgi:hypothetical protein